MYNSAVLKKNKSLFFVALIVLVLGLFAVTKTKKNTDTNQNSPKTSFWQMQAIDTVKYSRDHAGQYLNDSSYDKTIEDQVKKIAETGVTHIALGTPYDKKFIPYLKRWVDVSRKYGLKIWFRGNFSGWEKWFEFERIGREEHKRLLKEFIVDNGDLFEDDDIFTSCTECENGGPGDPRHTGDTQGFRQFLIDEYQIGRLAFRQIDKNVETNYFPMNYDVANLIMNKETTAALGGVVVIDHYVASYEKMNNDINTLAERSGGKIVVGEFGAPIPDLHGDMTQDEQANWVRSAFDLLSKNRNLIGVNYWTGFGGSTKLWDDDGTPRLVTEVIKHFYKPKALSGMVKTQTGLPLKDVEVLSAFSSTKTDAFGRFSLPYEGDSVKANVNAIGFYSTGITNNQEGKEVVVILKSRNEGFFFKIQKFFYSLFN